MGISVCLTSEEVEHCEQVGAWRNQENEQAGRFDLKVAADGLRIHQIGALGEFAASVGLGVEWSGRFLVGGEFREWQRVQGPDIGGSLQVRTRQKPFHNLLVHRKDPSDVPYVLADVSALPEVGLVGWAWGFEVQQECWWRTDMPRPCFVFPHDRLRHVADLEVF